MIRPCMALVAAMAAGLPAGAALAQAVAAPAPPMPASPGPPVTKPVWKRKPIADDYGRYYPEAAFAAKLKGEAALDCIVSPSGTLTGCEARDVKPAGQDFDIAALKISKLYKMDAVDADGQPSYGRAYRLLVKFDPAAVEGGGLDPAQWPAPPLPMPPNR